MQRTRDTFSTIYIKAICVTAMTLENCARRTWQGNFHAWRYAGQKLFPKPTTYTCKKSEIPSNLNRGTRENSGGWKNSEPRVPKMCQYLLRTVQAKLFWTQIRKWDWKLRQRTDSLSVNQKSRKDGKSNPQWWKLVSQSVSHLVSPSVNRSFVLQASHQSTEHAYQSFSCSPLSASHRNLPVNENVIQFNSLSKIQVFLTVDASLRPPGPHL